MKLAKKILLFVLVMSLAGAVCSCKKTEREYAYTTERPSKTCIPSVTYGCDIYTADLPSVKKMSGTVYHGEPFGDIEDEKTALDCALKVITDIYGEKVLEGFEPFVVTENQRAGCWIVHGTPKDNLNTGMSFVALRKSTGEVAMILKNAD